MTLKDIIDAGHKRSRNIKQDTKDKTEIAFYAKFPDKEIIWDNAFIVKGNIKVEVLCKIDNTSNFRSLNDLKRLKYQCFDCMLNNLKDMLGKFNYQLIEYRGDSLKIQCTKCDTCYSVSKSYPYSLEKSGHYCEGCVHRNCSEVANEIGFTYLFRVNSLVEKIKCRTCGTEKTVRRSDLFLKEVECKVCRENLYKTNLKLFNCEYIKRVGSEITFRNPYGDIRTTSSTQVYNAQFPIYETDYLKVPCQLYVIKVTDGDKSYVKIGISKNSKFRASSFKFKLPYVIVKIVEFVNTREAFSFEHNLHRNFKNFTLSEDVVNTFVCSIRRSGKVDGYTEWFDGRILPEVLSLLEKQSGTN